MDFGQLFQSIIPFAESLPAIRAIIAFFLVFFIPGFTWTFVFFKRINYIERAVLSIGLSIAMVTLSVLALNVLFGMRITGANALFTIILITAIGVAVYFVKRFITRRSEASNGD
jgi:uncharacterized membrane protein